MGQYYIIANIDKEEFIAPHTFDKGAKLMEWSYKGNQVTTAMLKLMQDRWKGDQVYVIGDYANDDNPTEPCYKEIKALIDKLDIRGKTYEGSDNREYPITPYDYIKEHFLNISLAAASLLGKVPRYIYNTATKEYIDNEHASIEWVSVDVQTEQIECIQISQLPILLAMGNGRGGGDYHSKSEKDEDLPGSWCKDSKDLIVSTKKLNEYKDYEEYLPPLADTQYTSYKYKQYLIDEAEADLCNISVSTQFYSYDIDNNHIKIPTFRY